MPHNFGSVIPVLFVSDVAQTIAYYRDILGYDTNQDRDDWGSAQLGNATFFFRKSEGEIHPVWCFVSVEEVDDLCTELRAKGATILEAPADQPWGFRQFKLEDLNGYLLIYFRLSDGIQ